jgi:hypothetical protein
MGTRRTVIGTFGGLRSVAGGGVEVPHPRFLSRHVCGPVDGGIRQSGERNPRDPRNR